MKDDDVAHLAKGLHAPDFKSLEPYLAQLDKYLTLRTYFRGYSLSKADTDLWTTVRGNKIAYSFLKKGTVPNLARWFNFIEETHPEIQEQFKVKDDAAKAKIAAGSKAGASYNIALQDAENGVVCRFPPEPSYVELPSYGESNIDFF